MEILAPAKVNLSLAITAKRSDGYHELQTVMQKIDLCDRLILTKKNNGISIKCFNALAKDATPSTLPENEDNIAFRAAAAFFAKANIRGGVEIVLEKKIPVAAGLGGGSSDAAAVLNGLNTLYEMGLSQASLLAIGQSLGADVPFFVSEHGAVFASGIGEVLHPVPSLLACWILLVNPGVLVSTKWVYDNFALTSSPNTYTLGRDLALFSDSNWLKGMMPMLKKHGITNLCNDLENVTLSQFPELVEIKNRFEDDGACFSLMSGSGSTLFGIFTDWQKVVASHDNFKDRYPGVFICSPVDHCVV